MPSHYLFSFRFAFVLYISFLCFHTSISAQDLPSEFHLSADGHILYRGDVLAGGLYDRNIIREVRIDFPQTGFWQLLKDNYASETEIPATMTIEGIVYDSVGVRFRGNTSYQGVQNSDKKSFAVNTDFVRDGQKIMGYESLKFNNSHQDPSMMREVLYSRMAKRYTPIAKANYIHLFVNQLDWGIYPNVQDVDKTFLKEWFMSNDGARFRATVEGTGGPGGGGGGGQWGDGTAGMNYLGADTATYQKYYTLKSTEVEDPWEKLIDACEILSTATTSNQAAVATKLDIDKILWFLAAENVFADDDSYIMKGKMDYYVYYEPETDLTFAFEYDGNSAFETNAVTSWSPFYNANKANYPLLNKLLAIPEWRQRYLAHYRTILNETFTTANANAIIDSIDAQIKGLVASDIKKLFSTAQYTNAIPALKTFISNRRNYLIGNAEVAQTGPVISNAIFTNSQSEEFISPGPDEEVFVSAQINSTPGISAVKLYFDNDLNGNFEVVLMNDDGLHHDGGAGDGIFGASIPGQSAGTFVRYYIEAIASNAALSASYLPEGAEHDVFIYSVKASSAPNGVVVNEILASNTNGNVDEDGQFEDWIELYNNNAFDVDLSGFSLSDKVDELDKWQFPAGTTITANGYLIVWADDDESDGPLHAGWKLSADGEGVFLSNAELAIVDSISFGLQASDIAFARVPNGTGDFVLQAPTFGENNEISSGIKDPYAQPVSIWLSPNPVMEELKVEIDEMYKDLNYAIVDLSGRPVMNGIISNTTSRLSVAHLLPGMYFFVLSGHNSGLQKLIKF